LLVFTAILLAAAMDKLLLFLFLMSLLVIGVLAFEGKKSENRFRVRKNSHILNGGDRVKPECCGSPAQLLGVATAESGEKQKDEAREG
jgi:hypothetical protein